MWPGILKSLQQTSQSEIENKMEPYCQKHWLLDILLRSRIFWYFCFRLSTLNRHYWALIEYHPSAIPWLILSHTSLKLCIVFNSFRTISSLHKASRRFVSWCHQISADWSNYNPIITSDCSLTNSWCELISKLIRLQSDYNRGIMWTRLKFTQTEKLLIPSSGLLFWSYIKGKTPLIDAETNHLI